MARKNDTFITETSDKRQKQFLSSVKDDCNSSQKDNEKFAPYGPYGPTLTVDKSPVMTPIAPFTQPAPINPMNSYYITVYICSVLNYNSERRTDIKYIKEMSNELFTDSYFASILMQNRAMMEVVNSSEDIKLSEISVHKSSNKMYMKIRLNDNCFVEGFVFGISINSINTIASYRGYTLMKEIDSTDIVVSIIDEAYPYKDPIYVYKASKSITNIYEWIIEGVKYIDNLFVEKDYST